MFVKLPLEKSYDEYVSELTHKGYKYIDGGSYGSVYATPSSKHVIKIAYRITEDRPDKWLNYAKGIIGVDNPFFPKIEFIEMYGHYNGFKSFYVAKMERLKPATRSMGVNLPPIISVAMTGRWKTKTGFINLFGNDYSYNEFNEIIDLIGGNELLPAFVEAIRTIRRIKKKCYAGDDIGEYNIMRRGKQLVIIDPIY